MEKETCQMPIIFSGMSNPLYPLRGLSTRLPIYRHPKHLTEVQKTDGVTEIPYDRWDVDEYFDPSPNAVGRTWALSDPWGRYPPLNRSFNGSR